MTLVTAIVLPSAERVQQLGASSVSLVPSGSVRVSEMTRVWPADTTTGGIPFLAADFGSVGAFVGFEGTESVQSVEMGNWKRRHLGVSIKEQRESYWH